MSKNLSRVHEAHKIPEVDGWTFVDSEASSLIIKKKDDKPKTTIEELQDENESLREENDELRSIVDHLRSYIRSMEAKRNNEFENVAKLPDGTANAKPQCAFCNDPNCSVKKKCIAPSYQSNKMN